MPYTISEQQLKDLFSQAGNVDSVNIIFDRSTRQAKGFAFVEMTTEEEAKKAIDMFDGYKIDDRSIVVNLARPREERSDRGRGGGRHDRSRYKGHQY